MGKNLKNADLVMRTGKLAFYHVPGNSAYTRMEGFTSLSTSKNATEYERQYVDEDFKRTDITGYATSTSYALDRYVGHPVTDDIIDIHENEKIGQDAVRSIIQVDMTTAVNTSGKSWTATGKMRDYAVIPDTDGDTTDCMTYSGTFKTRGEMEDVEVHTYDDFQTIIVTGTMQNPVLKTLAVQSENGSTVTLSPAFSGSKTSYTVPVSGTLRVAGTAESANYSVNVLYKGTTTNANGIFVNCPNAADGDVIYVIVDNGSQTSHSTNTYTITVSAANTLALDDESEEDAAWNN